MNSSKWIALCLSSFLALAGCGGGGETGEEAKPERRFLSVGTAPPGGAFFPVGGAIAEVLNAHGEGWQVTAEATKGSQENIRRLAKGELDLALANSAITYFAARGESGWDRPYPMRTVMTLAPNVALFVTPAGSGIRTPSDIKGKRVVVGPAGAGFEFFIGPLLEAHGVTYDDFTPLNNTQTGAVDIYAAGVVFYEMLTGRLPIDDASRYGLLKKIATEPPVPITEYCDDIPGDLVALIHQMLDKNSAERPAAEEALGLL